MRIGLMIGDPFGQPTIDDLVAETKAARDGGFDSAWFAQTFGFETLSLLAVIGREVDRIELGTAVVPTYPRHPVTLAQEAVTAMAASGGRITLGIGLSHRVVIESMYGMSYDKPIRHMREYLAVLLPLLRGERVRFDGEEYRVRQQLQTPIDRPCPVLVAALGPKMLELCGRLTDGTITWMTGPRTVADHITRVLAAAAAAADRPAPRVVVGLPVCVTEDVTDAHARLAVTYAQYGMLPSYRAMLDREGAEGPADVCIIGSADQVREQIGVVAAAGGTDLLAAPSGTADEVAATIELLASLAR